MKLTSRWPKLWLTAISLSLLAQSIPLEVSPRLPDVVVRAPLPGTTQDPLVIFRQRECANTCGSENQLCCAAGETCTTHPDGSASCSGWPQKILAARQNNGGTWQTFTSIWVETNTVTRTSIYSSLVAAATAVAGCNYAAQETKCDTRCCPSGYYCYQPGTCAVAGSGGMTTVAVGAGGTIPARPTTISGVVVTSTVRASTVQPYQTPVTTGGSNGTLEAGASSGGGLSGGAIAGIVIGVLLGIGLLFLLCFCCCLQGILGLFGKGKKKKDRRHTTVVSEDDYIRRRRSGGGGLGAALGLGAAGLAGRQWAGGRKSHRSRSSSDRYTRSSRRRPPPKKSKWGGGLTALASGAGAAALLSMFNKKKKGRSEKTSSSGSRGSYSYYSYTDSSSADSRSRRTSRRGGGGGGGRYDDRSRYSRTSRSRSRR